MVPPSLSEAPVPKAAKAAAPAKVAAKSLVPKPEKQIDEAPADKAAIQLQDYAEPVEKTWVRGTTDDAMVPASLSLPPKAGSKEPKIKAQTGQNGKDSEKVTPATSSSPEKKADPKKVKKPVSKKDDQNAPIYQDDKLAQVPEFVNPKKLTPITSTSPEKKIDPKKVKKTKKVAKKEEDAAPFYNEDIQLGFERVPVEDTWVRGTTNASMVDETPAPKAGDKPAKKAANVAKKAAKAAEAAPAKEEAIQIGDN